jgi:hypothetical protein
VTKASNERRRVATTLAMGLGSMLLLSGCASVSHGVIEMPGKDRYHQINEIKDKLKYERTGTVIVEEYDEYGNLAAPSYFHAHIGGAKTFSTLSKRVKSLPGAECISLLPEQLKCYVGDVEIKVLQVSQEQTRIRLMNVIPVEKGNGDENE